MGVEVLHFPHTLSKISCNLISVFKAIHNTLLKMMLLRSLYAFLPAHGSTKKNVDLRI